MSDDDRQEDCIFCRIVAEDVPSEKVYEDETVYAFKDANPKAAVHVKVARNWQTDPRQLERLGF